MSELTTGKPSLVDGISIEEILAPKPVSVEILGHSLPILPMPDETYMGLSEDIEKIVTVLRQVTLDNGGNLFDEITLMMAAPQVMRLILPSITRVIAGSLRTDIDVVSKCALADKVKIIGVILQVERAGEIWGNVKGLVSTLGINQSQNPEATNPVG